MSLNGYAIYDDVDLTQRHSSPWRVTRAEAEAVANRKLPKELFEFVPWGRRMLLVREAPEATYGKLYIPQSVQDSNSKAFGWVIAAGELVGAPDSRLPLGFSVYGPSEILLRKLAFGRHAGISYSVTEDPSEAYVNEQYDTAGVRGKPLHPYLIMTDGDIIGEIVAYPTDPNNCQENNK